MNEDTQLAVIPPVSEGAAFLQLIQRAASDPAVDVSKMQQLLDMRLRVMAIEAEGEFNRAMKAAQEEMRPVVRDAKGDKSRYARLETIDARIRPLYTKHGFSLSFNSGVPRNQGSIRVICDVRHIAGNTKSYELEGDLDTAGAKGTSNKTSIQGLGSSVSYLRRYLTIMIFNIALVNEDTDGARVADYINEEQVLNIVALLDQCGMKESDQRFLAFAGGDRVETIPATSYGKVISALSKRLEERGRAQ